MSTTVGRLVRPAVGSRAPHGRRGSDMLGNLYDRALDGERCWVAPGRRRSAQVARATMARRAACRRPVRQAVVELCRARQSIWVAALGDWLSIWFAAACRRSVSTSPRRRSAWLGAAVRRSFAAMCSKPCRRRPLADGAARRRQRRARRRPVRVLRRAAELLRRGGRCVAEFDPCRRVVRTGWVRLESSRTIGPWFRWASVGIDCAAELAEEAGLALTAIHPIGARVLASLTLT